VVMDDFDPVTMWAMDCFYPKPVIGYTSMPNIGLNIRTAQCFTAFADGKKELTEILSQLDELILHPAEFAESVKLKVEKKEVMSIAMGDRERPVDTRERPIDMKI